MSQPKVWLVTGASQGLGFEIAKKAVEAGHKVLAGYRNKSKNPQNIEELERLGCIWVQLDVSQDDTEARIQELISQHGAIDVLVNNAGVALGGAIEDTGIDAAQTLFNINFFGTLRAIRAVLPAMRAQKSGTIVTLSSGAVPTPLPAIGIYSASKAAVENMSEALAIELAPFSIRVLVALPGAVDTAFGSPGGNAIEVPLSDAYKGGPVEQLISYTTSAQYGVNGSAPDKVAARMVEAVDASGMFAAMEGGFQGPGIVLPLGVDGSKGVEDKGGRMVAVAKAMREVSASTMH